MKSSFERGNMREIGVRRQRAHQHAVHEEVCRIRVGAAIKCVTAQRIRQFNNLLGACSHRRPFPD
ncbi:MAG TPA: hypothetical protein VG943_14180 [Caulobacterales bacterium]|nr:hypothetical protein [Caulobacterales bacterium]